MKFENIHGIANFNTTYSEQPSSITDMLGGGQKIRIASIPKATEKRVQLPGQSRKLVIYQGTRGGQYVKMCGKYVVLSVAKERASQSKSTSK